MTLRLAPFGLIAALASVAAVSAPGGIVELDTGAATYFSASGGRSLYYDDRDVAQGEISCVKACLEVWTPFRAEPKQAGTDSLWAAISRPDDTLQWAYKGKPLYTYARDTFPGARTGDGAGRGVWKLMKEIKSVPAGMKIESTLLGYVLADHAGHTLYVRDGPAADDDKGDASATARLWQTLDAPWLAVDQGIWTIETPAGGVRQWAYNGQELYKFEKDMNPGDVNGHGWDGVWSAAILEKAPGLPSWMTVQLTDLGLVYGNEKGMTLYAPIDIDVITTAQTCPDGCMKENWRPVLAESGEESGGDWIIRQNGDGQRQWSYKGRLAYTHTRDEAPGDMRGHGIAVGYQIGDGWRIIPVQSGLRRDKS